MFTSRAEYRTLLRQDNADSRLTEKAREVGLVDDNRYAEYQRKQEAVSALLDFCNRTTVKGGEVNDFLAGLGSMPLKESVRISNLLTRPGVEIDNLAEILPKLQKYLETIDADIRPEVAESAQVQIKYKGYIDREKQNAEKMLRLENIKLKSDFDYSTIKALSTEARQKLERQRPATLGQAARIPGVSPADVNVLLLLLGR